MYQVASRVERVNRGDIDDFTAPIGFNHLGSGGLSVEKCPFAGIVGDGV